MKSRVLHFASFPTFFRELPVFLTLFLKLFTENHDNFPNYKDILHAESVRNCTQFSAKMVAIPSDQIVNANKIVRGAAINAAYILALHMGDNPEEHHKFFLNYMLTPILCNTVPWFIIICNCMKNKIL